MSAGNEVLYLLTATSAAEMASRLSFLEELNRRDEELANKVAATRERHAELQAAIGRARMEIDIGLQLLEVDRAALRKKMAETRRLVARLHVDRRGDPGRDLAPPAVRRVPGRRPARDR